MTSREWRADRRAVFRRDQFTCQKCSSSADAESLRTHPVGPVPVDTRTVHESLLVTLCEDCFRELRERAPEPAQTRVELFDRIKALTAIQGQAIADAADFASLATDLPGKLEAGESAPYPIRRRDLLLVLEGVDLRLDRVTAEEEFDLDGETRAALEEFVTTAERSQREMRRVVELVEVLVSGLGRCHVCFSLRNVEDRSCETCLTDPRLESEWHEGDGSVAFDSLYASINETLESTSETTETLTGQAATLAEALLED